MTFKFVFHSISIAILQPSNSRQISHQILTARLAGIFIQCYHCCLKSKPVGKKGGREKERERERE
jgi:hypothetical protein